MFARLRHAWYKRRLSDQKYAFLLDAPINDEFVAFDCETSGLDTKKAEIISIGAVKIVGNKVLTSERLDIFVKPERQMSAENIKIHHIRNCDLENAVDIREAIDRFLRFIGTRTLVGYYLEFDVAMIDKYLSKFANIKLLNPQLEVSALYYDQKIDPFGSGNVDLRFDSITKDLGIPLFSQHNSYYDALSTALIFIKLKKTNII
jgi:DNA polymerase III subunit epsilon